MTTQPFDGAINSKRILVVAAHPDDEVLGCGGTIARHSDAGDHVQILIVAEGLTSRESHDQQAPNSTSELNLLAQSAHNASLILGAKGMELLGMPDNRLDSLDRLDLVKEIEARVYAHQPDIVYTHHSGDVNIDHRRLHEAVITACRPTPGQSVKRILSFEVPSSTEWQPPGSSFVFQPNWYSNISDQLGRKLDALKAYSSEMRPWPHARSFEALEHLARLRGSQIGCAAAEAFCLLRNIA